MANQLLPPVEFSVDDLGKLSLSDRIAVWLDMLDAGHALVLAGLTRELGPGVDGQAAFRTWYAGQMAEHDRVVERMLWRMQQRRTTNAC